jgi:hypothetical protein
MELMQPSSLRENIARHRTGWRGFICALALVTTWCICPSHAQADCGQYVIVLNPSAEYLRNRPIEQPMNEHPACPCNGPQCRSSDQTPPMPAPAQITPDFGVLLSAQGEVTASTLLGNSSLDNWSINSEAHLLSVDPPPRTLS